MKLTIKKPIDFEAKYLKVDAGVRYWNDARVNGVEDTDCEEAEGAPTIPCAEYVGKQNRVPHGSSWRWRPVIDIDSGKIINWKQGVTADIHYKVCDDGIYKVTDAEGNEIVSLEGYVPNIMCPADKGYGDYIIMHVDETGTIEGWDNRKILELVNEEEED